MHIIGLLAHDVNLADLEHSPIGRADVLEPSLFVGDPGRGRAKLHELLEPLFALPQRVGEFSASRDVVNRDHDAERLAHAFVDGRDGILDVDMPARSGDQHDRRERVRRGFLADRFQPGQGRGQPGSLVDQTQNFGDGPSVGLVAGPFGQRFGGLVQELHAPFAISRDHRVGDAVDDGPKPRAGFAVHDRLWRPRCGYDCDVSGPARSNQEARRSPHADLEIYPGLKASSRFRFAIGL